MKCAQRKLHKEVQAKKQTGIYCHDIETCRLMKNRKMLVICPTRFMRDQCISELQVDNATSFLKNLTKSFIILKTKYKNALRMATSHTCSD